MSRSFNVSSNSSERSTRAQSRRVAVAGGLLIATAVAVTALAGADLSNRVNAVAYDPVDATLTGYAASTAVDRETLSARVIGGAAFERRDSLATQAGPAITDIRALLEDPAIRSFIGPSEYAWDFTAPDGVPGFGPLSPWSDPRPRIARAPAVD